MSDEGWTPRRRRALTAVAEHLTPDLAGAVDIQAHFPGQLAEPRFAGQELFVMALLDHLLEQGDHALVSGSSELEGALRQVEVGGDPYLGHGLRLLLGLGLEARYAGRQTIPWSGPDRARS